MNEERKTSSQHLPSLRPPSFFSSHFPTCLQVWVFRRNVIGPCDWSTNSQHFGRGTLLPKADFNHQPPRGVTPADWLIRDQLWTRQGRKKTQQQLWHQHGSFNTSWQQSTLRSTRVTEQRRGDGGGGQRVHRQFIFQPMKNICIVLDRSQTLIEWISSVQCKTHV